MTEQGAIGVEDEGRVVVDARGAALENGADDDGGMFRGELGEGLAGGAGDGFGEIEDFGALPLAEVLRAEEFLNADDLGAASGGFADAPLGFGEIFSGSGEQAIWMRPTRNLARCTRNIVAGEVGRKYDGWLTGAGYDCCLSYKALVLFDIDGTLVRRAGPHHREVLVYGIRRVTGLETTTEGIPVQGMLDPDILTVMMRRAGATRVRIAEALPEIMHAAEERYQRVCPVLADKHCPGVETLLERLTRRGILLGLVTGNLTRIGWRKLGRAGLRDYFRFGAFGEMAKTRAGLAKMAIREARRQEWIGKDAMISLIGDSPADVIAARKNGIRAIAVATGLTPAEELKAQGPDILLRDLRDLRLRMVERG